MTNVQLKGNDKNARHSLLMLYINTAYIDFVDKQEKAPAAIQMSWEDRELMETYIHQPELPTLVRIQYVDDVEPGKPVFIP